jgi:hypothetical protein
MSEFSHKAWSPRDFNVVVRDGVVELWARSLASASAKPQRSLSRMLVASRRLRITSFGPSRERDGIRRLIGRYQLGGVKLKHDGEVPDATRFLWADTCDFLSCQSALLRTESTR